MPWRSLRVLAGMVLVSISCVAGLRAQEQKGIELNTVLMESTFKILDGKTLGTAFLMGRPFPGQPSKGRYVLITAAHVLEGMPEDNVTLDLRRQVTPGHWSKVPYPVQIRSAGKALWIKHPSADVAVMYVKIPNEVPIPLLPTTLLADDSMLSKFEVHPGDDLSCLGYPFGLEANDAGFPVLRSGKIASYPLTPTQETKTFLFDFRVFEGNSGGPVYLVQSNRTYGGSVHLGETDVFIMGLVTGERRVSQQITEPYSQELRQYPLGLAVVVHASLIKEAIEMLPSPETLPDP